MPRQPWTRRPRRRRLGSARRGRGAVVVAADGDQADEERRRGDGLLHVCVLSMVTGLCLDAPYRNRGRASVPEPHARRRTIGTRAIRASRAVAARIERRSPRARCPSNGVRRRASCTCTTRRSATSCSAPSRAAWSISTSGRAWPPVATTGTSSARPFVAQRQPGPRPGRHGAAHARPRRLPRARAWRSATPTAAASSTSSYREHRIAAGQAAARRPAQHLRRGRRRGRRRSRSSLPMRRPACVVAPAHRRSTPTVRSSPAACASSTTAPAGSTLTTAMSAVLDLPDRTGTSLQLAGAWGREGHVIDAPLVRGTPVHEQPARLIGPPAEPLPRAAPALATTEAVGRGHRPVARVLGQLPGRGRGRSLRHGPGSHRPRSRDVHRLAPRAGRGLPGPGGRAGLDRTRASAACRTPTTGSTASASSRGPWRDRPRPVLLNSWEGVYFDFDEDRLRRDGGCRRGPRASSSSSSTTAGSASATTTPRRSVTGASTSASCPPACPISSAASTPWASTSASGSSPRW